MEWKVRPRYVTRAKNATIKTQSVQSVGCFIDENVEEFVVLLNRNLKMRPHIRSEMFDLWLIYSVPDFWPKSVPHSTKLL